jgi:hypothetical protein
MLFERFWNSNVPGREKAKTHHPGYRFTANSPSSGEYQENGGNSGEYIRRVSRVSRVPLF